MKHIQLYESFAFTNSDSFNTWFMGSKIVDDEGNPQVVYHGTESEPFDTFDASKTTHNVSKFGFWFSDDKEFCEMFGGNVISAFVSVKKPYVITQDRWNTIRGKHAKNVGWFETWRNELISKGYDGMIVTESFDKVGSYQIRNAKIIAVFYPTQIKSLTNNGGFDPGNPNIHE